MADILTRDVPSEVKKSLRRKAAKKQKSVNKYCVDLFIKDTKREIEQRKNGKA